MDNVTLGLPELIVILTVVAIAFMITMIPLAFFAWTLQKALNRCAPQNRAMTPGLVWLLLIPLFNMVWNFIVVTKVGASLAAEYRARKMPIEDSPGMALGIAYSILYIGSFIPVLGIFAGIACLVCWIIYWVKIAGFSARLAAPATMQTSNA
jgi:hypothetical protein